MVECSGVYHHPLCQWSKCMDVVEQQSKVSLVLPNLGASQWKCVTWLVTVPLPSISVSHGWSLSLFFVWGRLTLDISITSYTITPFLFYFFSILLYRYASRRVYHWSCSRPQYNLITFNDLLDVTIWIKRSWLVWSHIWLWCFQWIFKYKLRSCVGMGPGWGFQDKNNSMLWNRMRQ